MNTDQIMQVTFLALMGGAIFVSYLVSQRGQMGRVAQQASIWGLIFVGVIAAVGLWGDISRDILPRQSVTQGGDIVLPQQADGHYYVQLDVNGTPIDFVVDTGASQMVLSRADALRAGLDPESLRYLGSASTANGVVRTANVRLDSVRLGPLTETDVPAVVNEGEMFGSLLGMSYLSRFSAIQIRDGELVLTR
ncbi:TIGR02281 family clan AA aspartic protease [Salipiger sp. IMCC34102]|uniref:retropepsin-like aspartic protease family protein n=1 Tax=Salipiger sp. IMCC34102 TaxID=2510647 RepID=UPI00101B786F|nr:TIGR02281 family clan AA aspartic protease [Salipiger sp. IMCC34102]RYH03207.1 TIGR02281 family clan AA aspartic protease [Salipiger sp. IMCC34102]